MTKDVGTLAEIGIQDGDEVQFVREGNNEAGYSLPDPGSKHIVEDGDHVWGIIPEYDDSIWRIVSRAADTTGPVRTVTRREIVEGVHGNLYIHEASRSSITIKLVSSMTRYADVDRYHTIDLNKDQIDMLVTQLTAIRDAMEEQE